MGIRPTARDFKRDQYKLAQASETEKDTYGKWLPMSNRAAADRLDDQDGGKWVAEATNGLPDAPEAVDLVGDPPRTRTLNPEIGGDVAPLDAVTTHDHNQVMSKVGIADLKAHLSQHLRRVRGGRTITVVDRDTPVAQIVPYDVVAALEIRRATRKPGELHLPSPLAKVTDSLAALLQDRASG